MKKVLTILASVSLAIKSGIDLVNAFKDKKYLFAFVYIVLLLIAIISLIITVLNEYKGHIRVKKRDKINGRIVEFIQTDGKTVILSRDLSWVTDVIVETFREKVNKGDLLTIFLPEQTAVSKKLEDFAEVRYYGKLFKSDWERLTSRFTIIHFGTDSVRMTYPQENTYWHINSEYAQGDPAFTLAIDVIKLLDKLTSQPRGEVSGKDNTN